MNVYKPPYRLALEAIKLKMSELGLKKKDLVGKFASKGYISSLLIGRKPFHQELHIPSELFLIKTLLEPKT